MERKREIDVDFFVCSMSFLKLVVLRGGVFVFDLKT
jgi:hypothetical protein